VTAKPAFATRTACAWISVVAPKGVRHFCYCAASNPHKLLHPSRGQHCSTAAFVGRAG
jgi:hypothetical protein